MSYQNLYIFLHKINVYYWNYVSYKLIKDEKDYRKYKVVIHTLRHTFASHLAINGTPIFTIQKLMNHKDIKMTLRYAKLSPDSGRASVIELGF